jgi:hypothetical protein
MNQEPDAPTDLSGLEMDLAKSFQPAWVKETSSIEKLARLAASDSSFEFNDRGSRFSDSRDARRDRKPRKPTSPQRPREGDRAAASSKSRRPEGRPSGARPEGRPERRDETRRESHSQPRETFLEGWEVKFIPEPRGIEGLGWVELVLPANTDLRSDDRVVVSGQDKLAEGVPVEIRDEAAPAEGK